MSHRFGDPTHIFVFGKFDTVNIYKKLKINVLPVASYQLDNRQLATGNTRTVCKILKINRF